MPPDLTPWIIIGVFVSGLAATVIVGLRGIRDGKIVAGRHYDESLKREARWQTVAETALAAHREVSAHLATLIAAQREANANQAESNTTQREILAIVRAMPRRDAA